MQIDPNEIIVPIHDPFYNDNHQQFSMFITMTVDRIPTGLWTCHSDAILTGDPIVYRLIANTDTAYKKQDKE